MAEMDKKLEDLKIRLAEVNDLEMAAALLNWDQLTYMPAGGVEARQFGNRLGVNIQTDSQIHGIRFSGAHGMVHHRFKSEIPFGLGRHPPGVVFPGHDHLSF